MTPDDLTRDLIHHHRRAQALISALPDVDWDSDAATCAELGRALAKRRKITPHRPRKLFCDGPKIDVDSERASH